MLREAQRPQMDLGYYTARHCYTQPAQDRSVGNADGNCRLTVGIAGSDNPSPSTVQMSVGHVRNYGRLDRSARRVSYGLSFQSTHLSSTRGFISEPIAQENACSRACMAVRVRTRARVSCLCELWHERQRRVYAEAARWVPAFAQLEQRILLGPHDHAPCTDSRTVVRVSART